MQFGTRRRSMRGRWQTDLKVYPYGCLLVGAWQDLGLHELHWFAAAFGLAVAGLNAEHFRAAVLALKSLPQLIRHAGLPLLLLLHRLAAAGQRALATLRDDHFRVAVSALVPFSYLV
jgi:hypothetical protein